MKSILVLEKGFVWKQVTIYVTKHTLLVNNNIILKGKT